MAIYLLLLQNATDGWIEKEDRVHALILKKADVICEEPTTILNYP